jgi:transposase
MMVYRWIQVQREKPTSPLVRMQGQANWTPQSMAPRHLAWLFLRDPERLDKQEQQTLSLIRKSQPVEMAYGFVQQFVTWLKEHHAQLLDTWLLNCQQSGISDLVTFAQGLEKEGSALHAAFTLPYSNGPVEGKITKLKYIKRSMYGRAGFPLLRQKVLKAG